MIIPEDFYYIVERIKNEDDRQDGYLKLILLSRKFEGTPKEFERYFNRTLFLDAKNRYDKQKKKPQFVELEDITTDGSYITKDLDNSLAMERLNNEIPSRDLRILKLFFIDGIKAKELVNIPELKLTNCRQVNSLVHKYKKQYERK
jgi:DNA-directed RNA polymerase specialized sigma24 family protein